MPTRGKLKIFLGYAAGVGKTYQMLTEAQASEDARAAMSWLATSNRTAARIPSRKTAGLESIPRKVSHTAARRLRKWTRMPSSRRIRPSPGRRIRRTPTCPAPTRLKRWQDVVILLEAGIDVLTTLNVQHLESLNDEVWHITGVRARETVPDWVVQAADEVVMVDVTPRALLIAWNAAWSTRLRKRKRPSRTSSRNPI